MSKTLDCHYPYAFYILFKKKGSDYILQEQKDILRNKSDSFLG